MPHSPQHRLRTSTAMGEGAAQAMRDALDALLGGNGELAAALKDLGWPPHIDLPEHCCHDEPTEPRWLN